MTETSGMEAVGEEGQDDADALARRYLDLWEAAMVEAASDPALAMEIFRAVSLFGAGGAGGLDEVVAAWGSALKTATAANEREEKAKGAGSKSGDGKTGPAPAGPLSRDGDGRVAELEARIAALEALLGRDPAAPPGGAGGAEGTLEPDRRDAPGSSPGAGDRPPR